MLSRVAENLYWMSRYVERVENLARLLDVAFYLELDAGGLWDVEESQRPVEEVLTIQSCRDAYVAAHGDPDRDGVLRFLTFDRANRQSIVSMVARVRENARGAQETISAEAWSMVNRFYLQLTRPRAHRDFASSPARFFGRVKRACILFGGLVDSTLPRNEVYHFLQVGRVLERADEIVRIVLAKGHTLHDGGGGGGDLVRSAAPASVAAPSLRVIQWTSLLRSCSAYEAYQQTFRDRIDPELVVRLLVLSPDFPRAIRFCVARCRQSLREISGGESSDYGTEAERLLGRLDGELRYIDVHEIFDRGLIKYLTNLQDVLQRVGEEVHKEYFAG